MSDVTNRQKVPLARALESFANRKIASAMDLMGRSLPASVVEVVGSGVVKVKFELANVPFTLPKITVPVEGSEYVRLPIQVGMLGWVTSADVYLGGMSGLGGGTADLAARPNLSNLVWSPLGNKNWAAPTDPNALELYGPDGVIVRDAASKTVITLTASGITITLQAGDSLTINGNAIISGNLQLGGAIEAIAGGTYTGSIQVAGDVVAKAGTGNSVTLSTHSHHQPADSHGDTEQPTSSPTGGT